MLVMNEKEFEFDLFDMETARKYEDAFEKVVKTLNEIGEEEKFSTSIKKQCEAVRTCIDDVFGEGTGIQVCGEKYNLNTHLDAFEALVDEAVKQRRTLDDRGKKYLDEGKKKQFHHQHKGRK